MRILHISDTHGAHEALDLADLHADVLVHSGDICDVGSQREVLAFFDWFAEQPFEHKILVPGNHDYFIEKMVLDAQLKKHLWPKDFHLLVSEGVEIEGVKFWGSPVTPWFFDMAFNCERDEIDQEWAKVPADTQVLITHGPRYGVLDQVNQGGRVGCTALTHRLNHGLSAVQLQLHGHIHEAYGHHRSDRCLTLNSSIMNSHYYPVNLPQLVERQGDQFVIVNK